VFLQISINSHGYKKGKQVLVVSATRLCSRCQGQKSTLLPLEC